MFDIRQLESEENGEWGDDICDTYANQLMEAFAKSPEGTDWSQAHGPLGWAAAMVDFGIEDCGVTPVGMSRKLLEEILFTRLPSKMSLQPDEAFYIVGEIRAFWHFVGREYGLASASQFASLLDTTVESQLREKLTGAARSSRLPAVSINTQFGTNVSTR